VSFGSFLFAIF